MNKILTSLLTIVTCLLALVATTSALAGTVTDVDGNVYQTVVIGDQEWMAENLKVTHYRNGDSIEHVTDNSTWEDRSTGAYCAYDNDENNVATYGRLYNWYAVADPRGIAPEGWDVPTDEQWKQLEMYLGMSQAQADSTGWRGTDEGGKLKDTGTTHWYSPNEGATNESGFTALPGGYRYYYGSFDDMGSALFWSSTESTSTHAWNRGLDYAYSQIYRVIIQNQHGYSVRCVRDVTDEASLCDTIQNVIFCDDFEAENLDQWNTYLGDWEVITEDGSSVAHLTRASVVGRRMVALETLPYGGTIRADVKGDATGDLCADMSIIIHGDSDAEDCYWVTIGGGSTMNGLGILYISGGVGTLVASNPSVISDNNIWYSVLVDVTADSIKAKRWPRGDTEPVDWQISAAVTTSYGDHFGLGGYGGDANEEFWFDNVTVVSHQDTQAQLVLPGEASYDPDNNRVTQPVYAVSEDTLVGLIASFEVPVWADVIDTILTAGSATENWFVVQDTLGDLGYPGGRSFYGGQGAGAVIPPGSTYVFSVVVTPKAEYADSLALYTCEDTVTMTLAALDTCLSELFDYSLKFQRNTGTGDIEDFPVELVTEGTEFVSTMYIPGDFTCDNAFNISDLTALVAYLFNGGPVTCERSLIAADVAQCDGLVNVNDLTRIVNVLFGGGPPLECCIDPAPAPKLTTGADLFAEYSNGSTILTLSSEIDLSGLEVHLQGNGSAEPVSLADANLELVHGHADGLLKLGLLDLQGVQMIEAGDRQIVEIPGEYEVVHALGSSLDHRPVGINLAASAAPVVPQSFALHQNYPNPFNPATTISFDSPEAADYTLTVYNTLGQMVKRFEGTAQPGENEVVWDASANSSGVYFYKLNIAGYSATKKMMLLK